MSLSVFNPSLCHSFDYTHIDIWVLLIFKLLLLLC